MLGQSQGTLVFVRGLPDSLGLMFPIYNMSWLKLRLSLAFNELKFLEETIAVELVEEGNGKREKGRKETVLGKTAQKEKLENYE